MLRSVKGRLLNAYTGMIVREVGMYFEESSQYRIVNIDGTGPVKADFSTVNKSVDPGSLYLSSKEGNRNIVITVEYNPNFSNPDEDYSTVGALRQSQYSVYTPGKKINLLFDDDELGLLEIEGYVESNDPTIFTQTPQSQISIICTKPYFHKSPNKFVTYTLPSGQHSNTTFIVPCSNFVTTGFVLDMDVAGTTDYFLLSKQPNLSGEKRLSVDSFPFLTGDHIRVSTVEGERGITYLRSGATTSLIGYLGGSLVDTDFSMEDNTFLFTNVESFSNIKFTYEELVGGF